MRLQCKVPRVQQVHFGLWQILAVGLCAGRDKGWVVLAPHGQQWRLMGTKIRLNAGYAATLLR